MAGRRKVGNLLALTLLNLLTERPMYPYEMASMLRERGKDNAIKINWGSFYTVVQNLEKYGFIQAVEAVSRRHQHKSIHRAVLVDGAHQAHGDVIELSPGAAWIADRILPTSSQ